jgi:hypothetical protein
MDQNYYSLTQIRALILEIDACFSYTMFIFANCYLKYERALFQTPTCCVINSRGCFTRMLRQKII